MILKDENGNLRKALINNVNGKVSIFKEGETGCQTKEELEEHWKNQSFSKNKLKFEAIELNESEKGLIEKFKITWILIK